MTKPNDNDNGNGRFAHIDPGELLLLWMQLEQTASMILMICRGYNIPLRRDLPERLAAELTEIRNHANQLFDKANELTQRYRNSQERRVVPDRRSYKSRRSILKLTDPDHAD